MTLLTSGAFEWGLTSPKVDGRFERVSRWPRLPRVAAWPRTAVFALAFALYALLALSAYELFGAQTIGVTFFPPAGLTFAAFLALPRRHAASIAAAIVLGEIVVDLGEGNGIWFSLGWAAANLVEPFAAATVARRITPAIELTRRTAIATVVGGLVVGPALGASIGATTLAVAYDRTWGSSYGDIWIGDALGVLVVAPMTLLLLLPRLVPRPGPRRVDLVVFAVLLVPTLVSFWFVDSEAIAYTAIPMLAWPAVRVGPHGLAFAALALATSSTAATARDRGPWETVAGGNAQQQLSNQQLFLLAAIGGAWLLALEVRERRRAVERMRSVASDAALLARALHAGRMGVWTWDSRTNAVQWDAQLERLYGLEPGEFDGELSTWVEMMHPDDRDRVIKQLSSAFASRAVFHIEHRCVWRDGSVHHIEGIGEIALDVNGNPIGAFGVASNIDDRKRAEEERNRLLQIERAARERADLRAEINEALGYSLDPHDLANRIVSAAVPSLGDWCTLVITVDQPADEPITATAHVDPAMRQLAEYYQSRFSSAHVSSSYVAEVMRTGRTLYTSELTDELIDSVIEDEEQRTMVRSLDLRSAIVVALPSPLGILGVLELARTSASPPYDEADVATVEELAQTIGAALNSAVLYRRQLRSRRVYDTLQRLTGRLNAAVTIDDAIAAFANHAASGVAADSSMIYLVGEHGELELMAATGLDEVDLSPYAMIELSSNGPLAEAVRTRTSIVLRSLDELRARYPHVRPPDSDEGAVVTVPLLIRNEAIGGIVFTFRRKRRFFDEEIALLETLAGRCAGAIERARLYERQRDASLTLQRRLLPELPDAPPWLQVGACYEPSPGGEVGGDWYQLRILDDTRAVAALGDAVGRGITAAAAMGQLRAAIAGATEVDPHPSTVLTATNEFAAAGADTQCASLVYALIERNPGSIVYATAGHPPPVLLRADGTALVLNDGRGPLLGLAPSGKPFAYATAPFQPGDTLVFYSDGLIERPGESIDVGVERLVEEVRRSRELDPQRLSDTLVERLAAQRLIGDDIALLVVRHAA
ncbi:MAG TPA: SpoIIE family protein phosphatase [Acidimicrobiales bacterium]